MLPKLIALGIALSTLLGLSSGALAQGEGLTVLSAAAESRFPEGIAFTLSAQGPAPIERASVTLKTLGSETRTYGRLEMVPGTEVSGEYLLQSSGAQHIPPGTLIRYSFEVRDSAGQVVRTPEQEVVYTDNRFEWLTVSDGIVTVYYSGGSLAEFIKKRAEVVLDAALQTIDRMGPVLGIAPREQIRIVSYNNYRDMSAALPFRSQAVREDLQTQGQAWPNERALLVLGDETTVAGITSHELTHILVAEAAGSGYPAVPAWLNEGLAEFGNIDQSDTYTQALTYAIYTRKLKPLWHQNDFGGEPEDIIIGYGQGRSVVRYLIARYGPDRMAQLMQSLQRSPSIDDALQETYGFDQYGLDSEWRIQIGLKPLPRPGEGGTSVAAVPATQTPTATPSPATEATPATVGSAGPNPAPSSGGCSRSRNTAGTVVPLESFLLAFTLVPLAFGRGRRDRQ